MAMENIDPNLSDEDFLAALAASSAASEPAAVVPPTEENNADLAAEETQRLADEEAARVAAEQAAAAAQTTPPAKTEEELEAERIAAEQAAAAAEAEKVALLQDPSKGGAAVPGSQAAAQEPAKETPAEPAAEQFDYEAAYKKLTTTIRANGKNIEIKSPEEAMGLMQMGANYTRKMQELAPLRRVTEMLRQADFLNEAELSFAIDLVKKRDPAAIQKFLKDAKVPVHEIDIEAESTYKEGSHLVSQAQVDFQAAFDDLGQTQEGKETIAAVDNDWDQASVRALYENPGVLQIIHAQRMSGHYDLITAELARRRTLGMISPNVPFINAYRDIGNDLQAQGAFEKLEQQPAAKPVATPATPAAPVAVKVQTPPTPANDAAVKAASPNRTTTAKVATPSPSLAELSDEEFMKQFANRV